MKTRRKVGGGYFIFPPFSKKAQECDYKLIEKDFIEHEQTLT